MRVTRPPRADRAVACAVLAVVVAGAAARAADLKTRNVVLVTLDGARPEEVFGGLDLAVLRASGKKEEAAKAQRKYWAATPHERREKLMPFFWGTLMAKHGSIAGNRALGSTARVTNTHRFSYPGYSEILTGRARDDAITSNDKKPNPTPTVLELAKRELSLGEAQVAAFCSWGVLDAIVMHEPGAFASNAGFEAYEHADERVKALSRLQLETETPWDDVRHDAYTFRLAMAHLETHRPRVLYIGFGQPDDWSHDGRYDRVLGALSRIDGYLRELWERLESIDAYRGKTTILITTDHGRGRTTTDWTDHGAQVEGAQYIWLACVSPDSSLRGEWVGGEPVRQDQIAATIAKFLGIDYARHRPEAGPPIERIFR